MYVLNFDFASIPLFQKIITINIPVFLTEMLTYPLQRIQTQLIQKPNYIMSNQFSEMRLIFKQMVAIEGFPKMLNGVRYSLDFGATMMTFKILTFEHLVVTDIVQNNKVALVLSCFAANLVSTLASQSAFNYLTIASSFPIDKASRPQKIKQKLIESTNKKNFFKLGLQYTAPISLTNTAIELFIMAKIQSLFKLKKQLINRQYQQSSLMGYSFRQFSTALCILLMTSIPSHFANQRMLELCLDSKKKYPFRKGLLGSVVRHFSKNILLYGMYFFYFEYQSKSQIEGQFQKRNSYHKIPKYRQSQIKKIA